jgi:hypothetical protein
LHWQLSTGTSKDTQHAALSRSAITCLSRLD